MLTLKKIQAVKFPPVLSGLNLQLLANPVSWSALGLRDIGS
jgi:hypothetical protein